MASNAINTYPSPRIIVGHTCTHIYFKHESTSQVGSHKPNTGVAQVFFTKIAGTKALPPETGIGQWGSALSMACRFFDMRLEVYMVKVSDHQKPYRRYLMEAYGANVYPSPSYHTEYGQFI
jgi:tryptophan synthase beta chain